MSKKDSKDKYRTEGCLYQVVDKSKDGIYLQNLSTNEIFEEINMKKELMDKIGNDYIVRFINGQYFFEEKLTDIFFEEGLIDI